jgi:ring-1,2-phenylacetyl-CoA epoxidase subunit PaaE
LEKIYLRVTGKRQETHDTITFLLEAATPVSYLPGQFITLLIWHYGREVRRSFSLSSNPPELSITVKRKTNGEISRYLQDHVHVGDVLEALPPAGRFILGEGRDIGFIAAGSGIAPIYPLLRQALEREDAARLWLIDQNHSEADIIFKDALQKLKHRYRDRFTLLHAISPQRLTNTTLEQIVTAFNPDQALFMCCGPEPLMRMARYTLRLMGYRADQFRQEHFVVETVHHAPVLHDMAPKEVTLYMKGHTYRFPVQYPQNILTAALAADIPLPYSCRGGRCSTCAARCLKGKVVMSINDVLTEKDLAEGWVLTCTGYAETDLELSL